MKELEFRAWDDKKKEIVAEVEHLNFCIQCEIEYGCTNINDWWNVNSIHDFVKSKRFVLMQFVNQLDQNNKKIFEKDIVKWNWSQMKILDDVEKNNIIGIVEWEEDRYVIKQITKSSDKYGFDKFYFDNGQKRFKWSELLIIGNVYEKPELVQLTEVVK